MPDPAITILNGKPADPRDVVVPVLKETQAGRLILIGAGAYITRYGLFVTAGHVLQELTSPDGQCIGPAFVVHQQGERELIFRRIRRMSFLTDVDIGIGQAENYVDRVPDDPLMNGVVPLTFDLPRPGSPVATFAYPRNEPLEFFDESEPPRIVGNYYAGNCLQGDYRPEYPPASHPWIQTTMPADSGASGSPLFDERGRVCGVVSRSLQLEDGFESYAVPTSTLSRLRFPVEQLPAISAEYRNVPRERLGSEFTLGDLLAFRHLYLR